ncbi:MAG: hypothetical protein AAF203_04095, partial [Pseudomonadota bacterium]
KRSAEKDRIFTKIEPWKYDLRDESFFNALREPLIEFIGIFYHALPNVKKAVSEIVEKELDQISESQQDVSAIPAFSDVSLKNLQNMDPGSAFLALKLYLQKIEPSKIQVIFDRLKNKDQVIEHVFQALKHLVRWEISQLSVISTKSLGEKLLSLKDYSLPSIQSVVDQSFELQPKWRTFYSLRKPAIQQFLEPNIKYSKKTKQEDLSDFMSGIDRNIFKTTINPNMLALSHYIVKKTKWNFFHIDFNGIKEPGLSTNNPYNTGGWSGNRHLYEFMMTGQFNFPWFPFVQNTGNFQSKGAIHNSMTMEGRTTLFRAEMADSFYYFVATKTFSAYGIDLDDFLHTVSSGLLYPRIEPIEDLIKRQREIYYSDRYSHPLFFDWCEKLDTDDPQKESIRYYQLSEHNTPYLYQMTDSELTHDYFLFFEDYIKSNFYSLKASETFDKYRMEYIPILNEMNLYWDVAQKLIDSEPELAGIDLSRSKKYLENAHKSSMAFLGIQWDMGRKMSDCLFKAHNESKRRSQQSVRAEYEFLNWVLYPILQKLQKKELGLDRANEILRKAHKNHVGYFDEIREIETGVFKYFSNYNSFMIRARQMMISGMQVDNAELGKINIQPVVGSHLSIVVPEKHLIRVLDRATEGVKGQKKVRVQNPYLLLQADDSQSPLKDYVFDGKKERSVFIKQILQEHLMVDRRTNNFTRNADQWVSWDRTDTLQYLEDVNAHTQFYAKFHLLGDFDLIDFSRPECRNVFMVDLDETCIKKNQNVGLDILAEYMNKWFDAIHITEEEGKILDLYDQEDYLSWSILGIVLRFEQSVFSHRNYELEILPYENMAGFFDYFYQMFSSDYLGVLFMPLFENYNPKDKPFGAAVACAVSSTRKPCFWVTEKQTAIELQYARAQRPGLLFKFDRQILERQYEFAKGRLNRKFNALLALENEGPALLEKFRPKEENQIRLIRGMPLEKLEPLSPFFNTSESRREALLNGELSGFFNETPDWDRYLGIEKKK